MRCGNCGAQLKDGARFCESCGAKVVNTTPSKKNNSQPKKSKKGSRGWLFALLMASACATLLSNCHPGDGGSGSNPTSGGTPPAIPDTTHPNPTSGTTADVSLEELYQLLEPLLPTEEELAHPKIVIEPTPENSPGNPAFIEVSFTDEEYQTSPSFVAPISRELPEADFSNYGIHVNMKSYNLHNQEDNLFLEVMPVKTDPTYGHELYTYNFWLESGQDKFGTEVELTFPIHNGKNALRNVLWHNWETGRCEELFYTVSEDGTTCTAYIDHFTEIVLEEMTVAQLRELGEKYVNVYENGSVFIECINGFIGDRNHASEPVGLISTPDFKKIADRQTRTAAGCYEIVKTGGGIPPSAGLVEGLDYFGLVTDGTSTIVAVGQAIARIKSNFGFTLIGGAISASGAIALNLRVIDMTLRGVTPRKVLEENRWNYLATLISCAGSLVDLAGDIELFSIAATKVTFSFVCSWACVAIFAGTVVHTICDPFVTADQPFGRPETIEEGAYYEYLREPNTDVLKKLGIQSNVPLTGTGYGWVEAIEAIYKANKGILNAQQLGEEVKKLYEAYINYFWDGMPREKQNEYWRSYIGFANYESRYEKRWGFYPSDQEESDRMSDIIAKAGIGGFNGPDWESVKDEIKFDDKRIRSSVPEYKHRAMEALTQNTRGIVYDMIKKSYHENIKEARDLLYNNVLPLMNTMLYFYVDDPSLEQYEPISHSLYYGYDPIAEKVREDKMSKMEFDSDQQALFFSANIPYSWYTMYLKPRIDSPYIGRYNVFHYLQYGAPKYVCVFPPKDSNLRSTIGEIMLKAAQPYFLEQEMEHGYRVPVVLTPASEEIDAPSVDAKMYLSWDYGIDAYGPEDLLDLGKEVEKYLLPNNNHVYVLGDGTTAINLPAIQDFETKRIASYNKEQDCRYVLNRNGTTLSGKVIETEEGCDREYGHYTKYKGVIIGNDNFTGRWSSIGEDARHLQGGIQDKTTSFTAKYENHPRDGQTPNFSKFEIYHFTEADFYTMEIFLIGEGEEVKNYPTNDKPSVKKLQTYGFSLTTDLTKSPDMSGCMDWK